MDDDDDFDAWKWCWEVNLAFQREESAIQQRTCVFCGIQFTLPSESEDGITYASFFPFAAARCSVSHVWKNSLLCPSVCLACDVDLVVRITQRKQQCWADGCRRALVVDTSVVRDQLKLTEDWEGNYTKYLALVEKHRQFECIICCNDISLDSTSRTPTEKCQHDPSVCQTCLLEYVSAEVTGGRWRSITCPDQLCKEKLTGRDVHLSATTEISKR
jgi:hypothetical protein